MQKEPDKMEQRSGKSLSICPVTAFSHLEIVEGLHFVPPLLSRVALALENLASPCQFTHCSIIFHHCRVNEWVQEALAVITADWRMSQWKDPHNGCKEEHGAGTYVVLYINTMPDIVCSSVADII